MPTIEVVGPEAAGVVLEVVRAAFADRPPLDPPTDALAETEESIAARLAAGCRPGRPRRRRRRRAPCCSTPSRTAGPCTCAGSGSRRRPAAGGSRSALVRAGLHAAAELGDGRAERAVVFAREELPHTVRFWRQQGFAETGRRPPYVELARALPRRYAVPTADDMRDLATRVAGLLRAGDVLVLSGDLGAGKTTFTQGLGAALQVRGDVTSPTFVISRVHPSLVGGPDLVHVDAYRLGGAAELDDLDLDTDLDRAITVVEWGEGLAEDLADSPLEIRILRTIGDDADDDDRPAHGRDRPARPPLAGRRAPLVDGRRTTAIGSGGTFRSLGILLIDARTIDVKVICSGRMRAAGDLGTLWRGCASCTHVVFWFSSSVWARSSRPHRPRLTRRRPTAVVEVKLRRAQEWTSSLSSPAGPARTRGLRIMRRTDVGSERVAVDRADSRVGSRRASSAPRNDGRPRGLGSSESDAQHRSAGSGRRSHR